MLANRVGCVRVWVRVGIKAVTQSKENNLFHYVLHRPRRHDRRRLLFLSFCFLSVFPARFSIRNPHPPTGRPPAQPSLREKRWLELIKSELSDAAESGGR